MDAPTFRSTSARGGGTTVTFSEALLQGLAPDGGLYVPTQIPALSTLPWKKATSLDALARDVLSKWVGDEIPAADLQHLLKSALNFPAPLVPLERDARLGDGAFILELFHGPTLSFKDFGARTMARLMSYFLDQRDERLTILVATSGDTGSAVADGFAGQPNIDVVLLYPKGQVSTIQERQLIVQRPGVRAYAVAGSFDDCQRMVKQVFVDPTLAGLRLSSANSINIGRLLPQSLYYIWAVSSSQRSTVNFCVPSGNLGNLTAGVLAAESGLPVKRFIAAHNANDFFPRVLSGEDATFGPSIQTLSNAMDVGAPSNYERLRWILPNDRLRGRIWGTTVDDAVTRESIKRTYENTGYLADPHTAVGIEAAARYRRSTNDKTPVIVLATAHPAKFPETITEVLGIPPPRSTTLDKLLDAPVSVEPLEPCPEALRETLLRMA